MTPALDEAGVLLPCPFCGWADVANGGLIHPLMSDENPNEVVGPSGVICPNCSAYVVGDMTDEDAIAAWNRRTPTPTATYAGRGYLFDLRYGPDRWSQQRMYSEVLPDNPEDVRNLERLYTPLSPPASAQPAGAVRDYREEITHPNNRLLFQRLCAAAGIDLATDDIATGLAKAAAIEPAAPQAEAVGLPSYGTLPWDQLGRDVMEAGMGHREPYPFDPSYYPGHQMTGPLNFNSLARIVDKYRLAASPAPSPQPGNEPVAWEFMRSNGDGTSSPVIERRTTPPPDADPSWAIRPLTYATPSTKESGR